MDGKKLVGEITSREVDFSKWYTDVVLKTGLMAYSNVRGCMIIKPYGYEIWEHIKSNLDDKLKKMGHENVCMPMFIPESLLEKEKNHVEGFAPEVAWITHFGDEKLTERLCVRPTSETLFCDHYSSEIHSYRDLPKLYNQWCSVVRCEKTTRPFLRSLEFLWQEGHTAHATAEEAQKETIDILNVYADLCEEILAIPVIKGQKTEKEKFAGALRTYTIESLMHDGKALQSGTSHNFGDGFAKAFKIQYSDKNNNLSYVHQTSWGVTTRLIGALIMVHGDDRGLVLPPQIAPIQLRIIPIAQHKDGVLEKAKELKDQLSRLVRVDLDDSDKSPGWKFNESELKGIPLRLEIGPKDIVNNQAILVRRDTGEKTIVSLNVVNEKSIEILDKVQKEMLEKAKCHMKNHTFVAKNLDELNRILFKTPGFIKGMWCGKLECEEKIKEKTGATSRCIPFEEENIDDECICCGEKAKNLVIWAKAY